MKVNFMQNTLHVAKSNVNASKTTKESNMPKLKQLNKDTVSFGMYGINRQDVEEMPSMMITYKSNVVQYHPYKDDDIGNFKKGDTISSSHEETPAYGIGPSYKMEPIYQTITEYTTVMGERLPYTRAEAKSIPKEVLKSVVDKLENNAKKLPK
ncbi:MAG: hypothetical protein BHW64_01530 [Candidatus Melainabacteria bacterium LEY3_CP_29_8]|nr:MAG: hypothetical protein BHW64_01530 [Candidatus Melainabacteria bacterium LEY3_CP_29_8]